jgi:hypothetical protein
VKAAFPASSPALLSPNLPIATMNEGPLHAALKRWYAQPGDRIEVPFAGRQIDIVRGDLLIEIQTAGFSALRKKLATLLEKRPVRLVHPVAVQKWIVRVGSDSRKLLGRRKSPKMGKLEDVFAELVSLSGVLAHPRFSLEILFTHEEELRRHVPGRARRRKGWIALECRLVHVVERRLFRNAHDLLSLIPDTVPTCFTTLDIAEQMRVSRDLAQKIAYCLRAAGVIHLEGKRGNARIYSIGA